MTTIDNLLLRIINCNDPVIEDSVTAKDSRVLRSLANSLTNGFFITENQSRLLVKILRENQEKIKTFTEEIKEALQQPMWSRSFREIEQVKKLYLGKNQEDELVIVIECTFNIQLKKVLDEISKKYENITVVTSGKKYLVDLTEKNIVVLVDTLSGQGFDIEEKLKNHHEIIKNWNQEEFINQFKLENITNTNFVKHITEDLGVDTPIDKNIINDRSVRYQFFTDTPKNPGETLTEYIANRPSTKLWVDKNQHSLDDVIASLQELRRLPLLVVFDTLINNKYLENLEILSESLEKNGIVDNIGIYFRLPNDEVGKQFNQLIKDKQYNYELNSSTKVVAVQSGKLPKFFIKTAWKPMSVIALDSRMGLRHGKTAVYSNNCDLVIEWADQPAMRDSLRIKT